MTESSSYTRNQVLVHWLIVILVAAQYLLHGGIESAWEQRMDGTIANVPFPNPHAIAGAVILALTVFRVILRLRNGAPPLPSHEPKLLRMIASVTHVAFYLLLIGMPVSGMVAWIAGLEPPAEMHEVAAKMMLALIALHVAGAIFQKVWLKSDVMQRMSPARIFAGTRS